eukprot:CAMPEP_0201686804 /NCGR_PEP_ID=MMETSP0578-20130828/1106_1 /ASSEMBLY_ACC=CAM_ASM_000663 /TAXON_ID=267565 /ORGANISM="Skeletonema grethea, Strain CCMP 1804" /LENGTH=240 /DNA_ID=CAMNT_0048170903 /DNA_START=87 /DNA_END=809 /DNA_ORIENTATION=+
MTSSSPTLTTTTGKVAVIGATGGVGRFVVKHALKKGYAVVALARSKEKLLQVLGKDDFDRLESYARGSCDDMTKLEETISGADFVISCLGTPSGQEPVESGTKNVIATMKKVGVKNLAMISSCGVGDSVKQAKKNAKVFMYVVKPLFLSKLFQDLEEAEKVCKKENGLNIVRVRPPHLQDKPGKGTYQWVEPHVLKLPGGAVAAIPREDVALAMVELCDDTGTAFATSGDKGPSLFPMGS